MELKPRQLKLIEAMLANPMLPDTELAVQLGINRNTVREWKRKPEFQEELKRRLAEQWADSERMAMDTMQSLAREGDFKAAKYILDSLGYAPAQKIEAEISSAININIEE
jgi:uncharacterized protein YjcR